MDQLNSWIMSLSSLQLDAFVVVSRERHFSNAAKVLGITQSALSLRIKNLEDELGTTLFIRNRAGVQLTETAHSLLRYCQLKDSLETEFVSALIPSSKSELAGIVRICGFSSVMRSLILPALSPLLRNQPKVRLHFLTRELNELPDLLRRGEADYVVLDRRLEDEALESIVIGEEENVLVSPKKHKAPADTFLDHDENDRTTVRFFQTQAGKRTGPLHRLYLDDVYGIIDGVKQGLGRAVLPKHLIEHDPAIQIEKGYKPLRVPIVLHHFKQPYYSKLHEALLRSLKR
jgi:DNA-binding transcriptional LysR family regulator